MSFGRNRSIRALLAVGGSSLEAALDWLTAHQDDVDVDEAPPAGAEPGSAPSASSSSAPSSDSAPITEEEAAAAQAGSDAADAEAAMQVEGGGGGGGSSSSGGVKRKLTAEEMQVRVQALRAAKAEAAKEEARLSEIKRRSEGAKSAEAAEALRKAAVRAEEERRKREKEKTERESLYQKLELAKEKAERESRGAAGCVSADTAAKLKYLQDLWDGKTGLVAPGDPLAESAKKVAALAMQKAEDIGLTAARTIAALLGKVLEAPAEAKFRRVPWAAGKAAYMRIMPASAGLPLLVTLGWTKEQLPAAEGSAELAPFLVLQEAAINLPLLQATVQNINESIASGAFGKA